MNFYSLINTCATLSILLFNLRNLEEKKLLLGKHSQKLLTRLQSSSTILASSTFWAVLEIILISAAQYYIPGFANRPLGNIFDTGANYFGLLLAAHLSLIIVCTLLKVDLFRQVDLIAPAYPLALFLSKIACHFAGCCGGMRVTFTLFGSAPINMNFPVQLLESFCALMIFWILLIWKDDIPTGAAFPLYITLYSGLRFVSEFFRIEENVWGIFKTYHLFCMGGVFVGLTELFLTVKFRDKIC